MFINLNCQQQQLAAEIETVKKQKQNKKLKPNNTKTLVHFKHFRLCVGYVAHKMI